MHADYIPHSDEDIQSMMQLVGVSSLNALFDTVPSSILLDDARAKAILTSSALSSQGMTEIELVSHVKGLTSKNMVYKSIFLGAGCYHHFIPSTVDYLAARGEFWTAYTPYQAEFSQGFLQAIFEYQSMITSLAGMNYSNASLYDGATSLVDAIIMAASQNKKRRTVLIAGQINPFYGSTITTALMPRNITFKQIDMTGASGTSGESWAEKVSRSMTEDVVAVVICSPDFFGTILDVASIVDAVKAKDNGVITIHCIAEALSLPLLKSPGAAGVDIAVGEAQSLGIPMSFGGPALGFIAVSDAKLLHKMPGRIVGLTREVNGGERQGFTLTLTAREQHIRRERALSNICSNEALNMLRAAIYMASLGSTGLRQVARINVQKANHLKAKLSSIAGVTCINTGPTFNEFAINVGDAVTARRIIDACEAASILGPLDLGSLDARWTGTLLCCVTEMNEPRAMDALVAICKEGIRP